MKWGGKQHPVETLVEWLSPIVLACAVAWSSLRFGSSLVEAGVVGAVALIVGLFAVKAAGRANTADCYEFDPATFLTEPSELLLEAKDEILILDDPLIEPDQDSRVVRLFARHEPTPGELVERIEGFLGEMGRPATLPLAERIPADASAALYAALANVRASLR